MKHCIQGNQAFIGNGGKPWLPDQPWILLLHGAQNDHSVWEMQAKTMAQTGWNVVSPDLPCHGQSEGQPLVTINAMADWVASLITELGIINPVIAGHSMGSLIAAELATKSQIGCKQLILLGTSLPMPVSDQLLVMTKENPAEAMRLICKWSHNPGKTLCGPHSAMDIASASQRLMERIHQENSALTLFSDMNACNTYQPDLKALQDILIPVHVIAGEADKMTPLAAARKAADCFPHSQLHSIPSAGHALMTESSEEITDLMFSILNHSL